MHRATVLSMAATEGGRSHSTRTPSRSSLRSFPFYHVSNQRRVIKIDTGRISNSATPGTSSDGYRVLDPHHTERSYSGYGTRCTEIKFKDGDGGAASKQVSSYK